jgi:mannose-6-phosphate isomerase-like protein (cupin superfamily)
MRIAHAQDTADKGWMIGPWNSDIELSIGFANEGIDEPHAHRLITEIYLIARGRATVRVEGQTVTVRAGDVLYLQPGEGHTFISNSKDYFHFVIHSPGPKGADADADKKLLSRSDLGLDNE